MNNRSRTKSALLREVTALRQRVAALERSEQEGCFLAENMADVAFMVDKNLKITYVSPSIERLLGYSPAERMAQTIDEQLPPQSQQLVFETIAGELDREDMDGVDPNRSRVLELEHYHKNGTIRCLETHVRAIRDSEGKLTGFYGVSRDITERKEAEKQLHDTLGTLRKALNATIQAMVRAIEIRDPYTAGHQNRSADLAHAIATEMGFPKERTDAIRLASSIHDIGKLSVPVEILSKPTRLTDLEFLMIREHAKEGYEILKGVESSWPLAEIVYQHHERIDGSGYPRKLKNEEILMEARILAVADTVESMASHRPYRPAAGIDSALREIEGNRGILFDIGVVDACLKLFREKDFQMSGDAN